MTSLNKATYGAKILRTNKLNTCDAIFTETNASSARVIVLANMDYDMFVYGVCYKHKDGNNDGSIALAELLFNSDDISEVVTNYQGIPMQYSMITMSLNATDTQIKFPIWHDTDEMQVEFLVKAWQKFSNEISPCQIGILSLEVFYGFMYQTTGSKIVDAIAKVLENNEFDSLKTSAERLDFMKNSYQVSQYYAEHVKSALNG